MTNTAAAYLHSIAWVRGEKDNWPGSGPDAQPEPNPAEWERLRMEKLSGFYRAEQTPWELAAASAADSLRQAGLKPTDIDLILYSSESIDRRVDIRRDPDRFAELIGASYTPLMLVTANVCANMASMLRIARNAVLVGDAATILVVTTDTWGTGSRLIDAGTCLMSDAASSLIVSALRPRQGWRIGPIAQSVDHTLHSMDAATNTMCMLQGHVGGMQRLAEQTFNGANPFREEYRTIVGNNIGTTIQRVLLRAADMDEACLYTQTETDGHCFSADVTVNLAAIEDDMAEGELVLLFPSAHNYWATVQLERVGGKA